jgi:hypothetical protein
VQALVLKFSLKLALVPSDRDVLIIRGWTECNCVTDGSLYRGVIIDLSCGNKSVD